MEDIEVISDTTGKFNLKWTRTISVGMFFLIVAANPNYEQETWKTQIQQELLL